MSDSRAGASPSYRKSRTRLRSDDGNRRGKPHGIVGESEARKSELVSDSGSLNRRQFLVANNQLAPAIDRSWRPPGKKSARSQTKRVLLMPQACRIIVVPRLLCLVTNITA